MVKQSLYVMEPFCFGPFHKMRIIFAAKKLVTLYLDGGAKFCNVGPFFVNKLRPGVFPV